jgi:16S rRNA (guanine1207-N2)-methyltransferase
MAETYSAHRPTSDRRPGALAVQVRGLNLRLRTEGGVFSRTKLDRGTELLIEALEIGPSELVLDLGCGYGIVGIVVATLQPESRVVMVDVNERAVALAKKNVAAAGLRNVEVRAGDLFEPVAGMAFDHIVSNPPIRAGRRVTDRIVEDAPGHLLAGGSLWLVARTSQGAAALQGRMAATFGNAEVVKRGSGYKVVRARNPVES